MIRPLTLMDMVRLVGLAGSEWVVRRGRLSEETSHPSAVLVKGLPSFSPTLFFWDWLAESRRESILISVDGWHLSGLASACRRAGPTTWGVEHLVAVPGEEERSSDLLEVLAGYAGQQGVERIFLRLPDEWRLIDMARRSGFAPCTQLLAFTLIGRTALLGIPPPLQAYRMRLPEDDHPLFDRYSATTPAEVRLGIGLTLRQWKDAQEPGGKRTRELIVEQDGSIRAWVHLVTRHGNVRVQAMVDSQWDQDLRSLVALVLDQAGHRSVIWEVPAYQEFLRLTLERVGFQASTTYQLMIKSLVARVEELATAPASV
jgi:hypothetical protein